MSHFEDNLWGSIVDRHGDDLARAGAPAATRAPRTRTSLLAGASGVLAAAAAAVVLLVGAAASPSSAFAVTVHKQSVSVKIYRQSGIAAANRKLAAIGIHQRLSHVSNGQTVTLSCLAPGSGPDGQTATFEGVPKGYSNVAAPAVGSTWHVVACSSLTGAGTTGTPSAG
jgi:hypothetical protein